MFPILPITRTPRSTIRVQGGQDSVEQGKEHITFTTGLEIRYSPSPLVQSDHIPVRITEDDRIAGVPEQWL